MIFGDVLVEQSYNNYIHSSSRLISVLGVENLIIVGTKDAILISNQDKSQEIKSIAQRLKKTQRMELLQHKEVVIPWGKYDCIDIGKRYQIKKNYCST